ncbi:hypothetical protein OKW43_006699 [Paraburkholderia sp. WC7.3g]|uniref:Uncharacterized protein n=1 Tax=Paraburkholderia rhynchosiae TaxID=487049 RepID=A0A6J5CP55_9BURK|nr:hypothetical protein LMG27174_06649 [Paraburkholderia rhynchosiae]
MKQPTQPVDREVQKAAMARIVEMARHDKAGNARLMW